MKISTTLTKFFFSLLTIMLALGQIERVQVTSHIAVYAHDILLVIWCSLFFVFNRDVRTRVVTMVKHRHLSEVLFVAWSLIGLGTAIVLHRDVTHAVLYWARITLYLWFAFTLVASVRLQYLKRGEVLLGILFSGLIILVFGILQYIFLPDTRFLYFLGWDDHYYRLISTILDPGFTGIVLVITLFLLQTFRSSNRWIDAAKKCASFALLVGISLTYSRASYVACLSGFALITFVFAMRKKWRRAKMPFIYAVFFCACVPLLPRQGGEGVRLERTSTVTARTASLTSEIDSMQPLDWTVGHGLFISPAQTTNDFRATFDLPSHANIPDNWFVLVLLGTGILGVLLFLIVIGQNLWTMWRMNLWFFASGIAVLIHGVFNASLFYPFVMLFFAAFAASLRKVDR